MKPQRSAGPDQRPFAGRLVERDSADLEETSVALVRASARSTATLGLAAWLFVADLLQYRPSRLLSATKPVVSGCPRSKFGSKFKWPNDSSHPRMTNGAQATLPKVHPAASDNSLTSRSCKVLCARSAVTGLTPARVTTDGHDAYPRA